MNSRFFIFESNNHLFILDLFDKSIKFLPVLILIVTDFADLLKITVLTAGNIPGYYRNIPGNFPVQHYLKLRKVHLAGFAIRGLSYFVSLRL